MILYQTLGKTLPEEVRSAAFLWYSAQKYAESHRDAVMRAGIDDRGAGLGEALFEKILDADHGMVFSHHRYEDTWSLIHHRDRRVHLAIPEMLEAITALGSELSQSADSDYPLVLMAGERRGYNANTIYRDPSWRKTDREGRARINPDDAARLGINDGDRVVVESQRGALDAVVEITDQMLPGVVSMPHGYGMNHPDQAGQRVQSGPLINHLTSSDHCDPLSRTPYHKYVPVRIQPADPQST